MPVVDRRLGSGLRVPNRTRAHAIRVCVDGKHNHVAQKSHRLFVGAADELMHRFHQLLGTENFGGMQPPSIHTTALPSFASWRA